MGVGRGAGSAGTPFLSPPSGEPGIALGNSLCLEKCRGAPTPGGEALGVFQPVEGRAVAGVQAAGPPAHASVSTPGPSLGLSARLLRPLFLQP